MRIHDIITAKRRGCELSKEDIQFVVRGTVDGSISDGQLGAFLMAACLRGLSVRETSDLTLAIAGSGVRLDFAGYSPPVVDKHSTGGVGDKTTLVVAPLVAACQVPVAKISGHGLGFTGGTLDKLSAIPGLRTSLSRAEFVAALEKTGMVIAGQSGDLAPADGRLYAVRDETATVDCPGLIVSSILGKKLAAGAEAILIDVKVGSGALMKTEAAARELAQLLVEVGGKCNRRVSVVMSSMEQPLGRAIGNSLEVAEAIDCLAGRGPADLLELSLTLGAEILVSVDVAPSRVAAREMLLEALTSGRAKDKLADYVGALGGQVDVITDTGLLPRAPIARAVCATESGFVRRIDAEQVGWAVMGLGGGRSVKGQAIDTAVGVVLDAKVGDRVQKGQALATIHARIEETWVVGAERVRAAFEVGAEPVAEPQLILGRLDQECLVP